MWKYQCKRHLAFLLGAAIVGTLLFGYFGYSESVVSQMSQYMNASQLAQFMKEPYMPYILGALAGAGAVNGLLLTSYIIQRFHLPFILMYVVIIVLFPFMSGIGVLLLIPAIIVSLFGWITIPNRSKRHNLKKNAVSTVAEIERVYRLHHTYVDTYEDLAKKIWDYTLRMNLAYIIGLLCVFLFVLWANDIFVLFAIFVLYAIFFLQLNKRKAIAIQPIISLLYEDCNPEACASAIFALARKARKRKSFPLPQYLAQSMLYLNDPHLAADVMVTCERNKNNNLFPYYSIMSYVYYQLGDRSMVKFQYEECEKHSQRMNNGPMAMVRQQCLAGIDNKLNMMDKAFDKVKTYYESLLQVSGFEFQKVDAHYYLGLICFVEHDLDEAKTHFTYVETHGNQLYFKEKATKLLRSIQTALDKEEEAYSYEG